MSFPLWPFYLFRRFLITLLTLVFIWLIFLQIGCFSFRTPDAAWASKFSEKGQTLPPQFMDVVGPENRFIHAVYVSASDSLPLLLFVHGSPGSADNFWTYLADTNLSQKVRMATMDRPGFGYTDGFGKAECSLAAQAGAVKAVVDALSPARPVILFGHSLGAPVITRFAMDYPKQTAGLVLIGGSVDPALEPNNWWEPVLAVPPMRWIIPKSFRASNDEIMALEDELTDMMPHWEGVQCPVLLLHAVNDRLVPVGNVDFVRRMVPDSTRVTAWVYPEGDHFFLWTNPGKVLSPLNAFIDKIQAEGQISVR
jgi:pimeloyl-ACP methyl ester carboxylesterase